MKCKACGIKIAGVHYCGGCRAAAERLVAKGTGFGDHEAGAWYALVLTERSDGG